jgi:uncharacterized secreted protein with C-terminal beta-propeller domain
MSADLMTAVSYKVDTIVEALFVSMDKDQVETVFSQYEIADKAERIQLLRKCMKVIDTSNADESLSLDDEYNDELEIFLQGTWRFLI